MEGYRLLYCQDFTIAYCNYISATSTSTTNATATSTATALPVQLLDLITLAAPGDETHQPQTGQQHGVSFGLGYCCRRLAAGG